MAKVVRPIGHEDRLSIVDHLDELRSRLIVCMVALLVAFAVCFWQNHALLALLNRALPHNSSVTTQQGLGSVASQSVIERNAYLTQAAADRLAAASPGFSPQASQAYARAAAAAERAARSLPNSAPVKEKPITLGVGEPFTTTLTVAAYFALLFSLPLLIYEAYAFVLPALNRNERHVATPLMMVGAGAVPGRRVVRLLIRAAARRPLPPGLQPRAVRRARPGQGLLLVPGRHDARDRPGLPAAARSARAAPDRRHQRHAR